MGEGESGREGERERELARVVYGFIVKRQKKDLHEITLETGVTHPCFNYTEGEGSLGASLALRRQLQALRFLPSLPTLSLSLPLSGSPSPVHYCHPWPFGHLQWPH